MLMKVKKDPNIVLQMRQNVMRQRRKNLHKDGHGKNDNSKVLQANTDCLMVTRAMYHKRNESPEATDVNMERNESSEAIDANMERNESLEATDADMEQNQSPNMEQSQSPNTRQNQSPNIEPNKDPDIDIDPYTDTDSKVEDIDDIDETHDEDVNVDGIDVAGW